MAASLQFRPYVAICNRSSAEIKHGDHRKHDLPARCRQSDDDVSRSTDFGVSSTWRLSSCRDCAKCVREDHPQFHKSWMDLSKRFKPSHSYRTSWRHLE